MGSVATCRVLAGDHTESVFFRPRVTPAKAQRIHTSNVRLHAEALGFCTEVVDDSRAVAVIRGHGPR